MALEIAKTTQLLKRSLGHLYYMEDNIQRFPLFSQHGNLGIYLIIIYYYYY